MFFRNTIEVVNLLDAQGKVRKDRLEEPYAINVGVSESQEDLVNRFSRSPTTTLSSGLPSTFLYPAKQQMRLVLLH